MANVAAPFGSSCDSLQSMARKATSKSKLTDAERHKRFVEMALEVEASDEPDAFDKAFDRQAKGHNFSTACKKVLIGSNVGLFNGIK